jgi:hypothetical protein
VSELTTEQVERIRDFVSALRSGAYDQTHHTLGRSVNDEKSYCCEGVAVERYGAALGYEVDWRTTHNYHSTTENDTQLLWARDTHYADGMYKNAPMQLWVDMGLAPDLNADFAFELPSGLRLRDPEDTRLMFYDLNDDGFTFDQIADMIEWQFLHGVEVKA